MEQETRLIRLYLFLNNIVSLVVVLFLFRLAFLFTYRAPDPWSMKDLLTAFGVGLRFDLSTAAYVLIPLTLLIFIPTDSRSARLRKIFSGISLIWFGLLILCLFVDLIYYSYAGRHLTFEIFNTTGDLFPLLLIGLKQYLPGIFALLLFMAFFSFCYAALVRELFRREGAIPSGLLRRVFVYTTNLLLVAGLTVVLGRGGLQMKPQKMSEAYLACGSTYLGNLALNGVYTSLRTLYSADENKEKLWWKIRSVSPEGAQDKEVRRIISPEREEVVDSAYPLFRHFRYAKEEFRPLNVVIFIMESWTGKFTGSVGGIEDATPFFSSLSREGIVFRNFFASGQRSIEGISAVLTSLPPWGGMILSLNATLAQMPVKFLPAMLQEKGYNTYFIHGAKYDSMGFASLTRHAGLSTYISKKEILKAGGKDDGIWGIYDEDTFQFAHRLFTEQKQPFFSVIFSLSSHTPYKRPSKDFDHYGAETPFAEFLNSLRYSDYALARFFEEAKKAGYFRDTVFVILGDHTEGSANRDNLYEMFHVPCLIYAPAHLKPMVIDRPVTQADLAPTILDILRSSAPHASAGISALTPTPGGQGLLAYGDRMVFVKDDWLLLSSVERSQGLFNYRQNPDADLSEKEGDRLREMEDALHAHLLLVNDLVVRNRLFPPRHLSP
ncbi:MAG: hypothetical protein C0402_14475 [Thermodesulfovibrio sp.]|nr:hypothetical protein [Thermodesulfovibrio sp.]